MNYQLKRGLCALDAKHVHFKPAAAKLILWFSFKLFQFRR